MSTAELLAKAADVSPSSIGWVNPFTGAAELWSSNDEANRRMFEEAARRVNELQAEIDAIKAFLVI